VILLESHAGARPGRAPEHLEAVRAGLGSPPPVGGEVLDGLLAERLSVAAGAPDFPLLGVVRGQVIDAQEDVVRARFADAVTRMERVRRLVGRQAAAVTVNPRIRTAIFEGSLAALKALLRLKRQSEAESLAMEVRRSFPDHTVTERDHGPELAQFFAQVHRQERAHPRAAIQVETLPPGAAVFLNERYVGTSPLRIADLLPGRYRVLARAADALSRVHPVTVLDDAVEVRIDVAFDGALGPGGFRFADESERAAREAPYALRLARLLGATELITTGRSGPPERPLWVATLYNVETGGVLRAAAVALGPVPPPRSLLVALGRFLRAGGPAEGLLISQEGAPLEFAGLGAARAPGRPWRLGSYLGLGAGLALVGVGSYLAYLDGRGTCELATGQVRCPEVHQTMTSGVATLAAGGAVLLGAATLFYLDRRSRRTRVGVTVGHGAAPTLVWAAGTY
jgi:hypothetical protein